jgi:MarR family multiple antibiotic resistance transcriptional regulator
MEDIEREDALRFFDLVVQHEMTLWGSVEAAVHRAVGVRLGSFQGLRSLAGHPGGGRVQDIADDLGITAGAASKVVARLVAVGYVDRAPSPDDARSSTLTVTGPGQDALRLGLGAMRSALHAHTADRVDDRQLSRLIHDLGTLTAPREELA